MLLIKEWGYVLVVAAGFAVCLFCWLSYACFGRRAAHRQGHRPH